MLCVEQRKGRVEGDVLESPVCIPWTHSVCILRFCCGFSLLRNWIQDRYRIQFRFGDPRGSSDPKRKRALSSALG